MTFRPTITLAFVLGLALTGMAAARGSDGLPGVFPGTPAPSPQATSSDRPVLYAQASDPRVTQLEEQVRQLNGTIEELNFQLLQMQEQLRKMQEDNEFRFQELEQRRSDAGAPATSETASRTQPSASGAPRDDDVAAAIGSAGGAATAPQTNQPPRASTPDGTAPARGEPPRDFGTITFDADGNPVGGSVEQLPAPRIVGDAASDNTTVAALPQTSDPEELYRNSYEFMMSGDYKTAEAGFRDYIERFPEEQRISDANFWLGESLLGQERYRDAAETFLSANRNFPQSRKAPDMLLKLGVSLAALNQREIACATYREIGERYPQTSEALRQRVTQEQALAGC